MINDIKPKNLINLKEIYSFPMVKTIYDLPKDNFNVVCDNIISEMMIHHNFYMDVNKNVNDVIDMIRFRDQIYDILIYNLDASECIWYIFTHFISLDYFDQKLIDKLLEQNYIFLKQYGNNYRAIFHIESILFTMITSFKN